MEKITNAIPVEEWARARALYDVARVDERSGLGQVRLRSDGRRRRWYASDSIRAACLEGGPDSGVYDVGIPPALLRFAIDEMDDTPEVELVIDDAQRTVVLRGSSGSATVEDLAYGFPVLEDIRPGTDEIGGRATVRAGDLLNALDAAWLSRRADFDEGERGPIWFSIGDGAVHCRSHNSRASDAAIRVESADATGSVLLEVNPEYMSSVVALFRPHDDVSVQIPRYAGRPILIEGTDRWAMVMPVDHRNAVLERSVEAVIEEEMGHLAVRRDLDGDYPLVRRSTPVFARLVPEEDPPVLQVFAVVVRDIESSPELLAELNDLNRRSTFARVFHLDGQVLAEVDLVAETLDATELHTAVQRVWDLGQRVMPTLSAVFGGEVVPDPAALRFAAYRATVVEAEVTPGLLTSLNGSDAADHWPFPGSVHVITGWDPQGVSFDEDENERVNRQIAAWILEAGGRFVHGHGRSPSDDHSEGSLVAWGLDRDVAVSIGRRASQDAIFEIDADTMRLVSCIGDDVEEWTRRP